MKYEIDIDESLVPEGKVPDSLERDRTMMLVLKFKKAHVPKIPDFVPEGWYFTINRSGIAKMHKDKPYFDYGIWRSSTASFHLSTRLNKACLLYTSTLPTKA